ncbi:multidrug effflux MFS transporter [Amycolatopsis sp. WQ 127309]|uniref:multidrug effflux MFS transporter n=1 Tax=Amycolatopsis sp. WQ 127309 TaxID=2932773 RepID=UPI001FF1EFD2|nr:multidrug effflux MFS transporter [Amycolatopsis sp. WQ 127309]UOZ03425.1 multidrug effflux MFS transporter [Amycolatopsis sp. WQ 127309]
MSTKQWSGPGERPIHARDAPSAHGEQGLLSRSARIRMVLLLGSVVAIGPLTTDMYLPALPAIGTELHASASAIQLTLTATLAGLALGQLLVGPLSDRAGRRRPLLAGVAVHIVASALCLVAPGLLVLDVLRVLQGLGAATSTVIAMAIVRDLFSDSAAATVLSRLMLVTGVSPILGPTLGGVVLNWTDWRGIFAVIAVVTLLIAIITGIALPETLVVERRRRGGVTGTLRDYRTLFRDRVFLGLILVTGLVMSTIFAFVSGSPFVFQTYFGLDEQAFGYIFGAGALWVVVGTQLNARLLRRRSPQRILVPALVAAAGSAVLLLTLEATGAGGIVGSLIPLWMVLFSVGFALPNAPALAMSRHGEAAGTAAALLGAVQFGVGALAAPVVGLIGTGPAAMATVIAAGLVIALLVLALVVRPRETVRPLTRSTSETA